MECPNCKAVIVDGSKFCNKCGTVISAEIVCSNCKTVNPPGSIFCNNCGTSLTVSSQEVNTEDNDKEVILGDDFVITLRDLFFEKLQKRINLFNDTVDLHSSIKIMDGSLIKRESTIVLRNCFDHLISATKDYLSKQNINFIKTTRDNFLAEETVGFFEILADLDTKTSIVLDNVPNSTFEGLAGHVKNGLKIGLASAVTGGIGTVFSLADYLISGNKKEKIIQQYQVDWNTVFNQVWEEYIRLWDKLLTSFGDIAKETPIVFDISDNVFEEYDQANKNPIESIIENNLAFEGSGFYFYSDIPAIKKAAAIQSYAHLEDGDDIICLHDSTVFGGAKEGICLTNYGIYWKIFSWDGNYLFYTEIEKIHINENQLFLNDIQVETCPCINQLKKALEEIVAFFNEGDNIIKIVISGTKQQKLDLLISGTDIPDEELYFLINDVDKDIIEMVLKRPFIPEPIWSKLILFARAQDPIRSLLLEHPKLTEREKEYLQVNTSTFSEEQKSQLIDRVQLFRNERKEFANIINNDGNMDIAKVKNILNSIYHKNADKYKLL